jgi:tetratricopeptide (TPR) repeat protein
MKLILLFLVSFISIGGSCQDSSFVQGNTAYAAGDYEAAVVAYSKIVATDKMSSSLYYNLGNSYYKLGDLGHSIWAYERALKIDPSHTNAQLNLEFVNAQTYDKLELENTGITYWLKFFLFRFGINFWAYISILLSVLFSIVLFLFFTSKSQKVKNTSLTFSFASLFGLLAVVIICYFNQKNVVERMNGVIISEFVEIRNAPSETAPSSFKLHEGTKVDLLRSNETWHEVGVNGNVGWILKSDFLEI